MLDQQESYSQKAQLEHYPKHNSEIWLSFLKVISLVNFFFMIAVMVKAALIHCLLQKLEVNQIHTDWQNVTGRQSKHTTYHQHRTGSKWLMAE